MSGKCDLFYADGDLDGYPDHYNTQRFCTFPTSVANGPNPVSYIAARSDAKWDCCDMHSGVHPDATAYAAWSFGGRILDNECMAFFGDSNCDGHVEVDPSAVITTGCDTPDGVTCNKMTRTPTAADCAGATCGCGAPSAGGFCSLYCAPGGAVVLCR